jgi:Tubulin-tyrosine ligase family
MEKSRFQLAQSRAEQPHATSSSPVNPPFLKQASLQNERLGGRLEKDSRADEEQATSLGVASSSLSHHYDAAKKGSYLPSLDSNSLQGSFGAKPTRDLSGLMTRTKEYSKKFGRIDETIKSRIFRRPKLPDIVSNTIVPSPLKKDAGLLRSSSKQKMAATFTNIIQDDFRANGLYNRRPRFGSSPKTTNLIIHNTSGSAKLGSRTLYPDSGLGTPVRPMTGMSPQDRLLYNLFNSMYVRADPKSCFKPKFFVGKGNNQKLVTDLISQREPLISGTTMQTSNIVWTQLDSKEMRKTNIGCAIWLHFDDIRANSEFKGIELNDINRLTSQFAKLSMFAIKNLNLVKEIFENMMMKKSVHMIPLEQCSFPNHIRGSVYIGRKSLLTETVIMYFTKLNQDPFKLIPRTFLIKLSNYEVDMKNFRSLLQAGRGYQFPLIIKPGENTNRGTGITIAYKEQELIDSVSQILASQSGKKQAHSVLVQNYLVNPLLFKARKFDIRCYGLAIRTFDRVSFYWYNEGYARTSSYTYNSSNKANLMVHLTNEAVQVQSRVDSCRQRQLRQVRTRQQDLLQRARLLLCIKPGLHRKRQEVHPRYRP